MSNGPYPLGHEPSLTEPVARHYDTPAMVEWEDPPVRAQVLRRAEELVCGVRNEEYGTPYDSLKRIADLWSAYLGKFITAHEASVMMVLLKASRSVTDSKADTFDDMASYAALAYECLCEERSPR